MKGYSKIKGNHPFISRSKSNKEFLFLDTDFELLSTKKAQVHEQEEKQPRIIVHEDNDSFHHKKNDSHLKKNKSFFLGKTEDYEDGNDDHQGEKSKSNGGFLKRNSSVKKNNMNVNCNNDDNHKNIIFERQGSTRAIQEAVKRAFSINRSSSVNSDRYSRIYDQPISINVDDYDNVNHVNDNDYDNQDYDFERIGSLETRSMKKNQDGYGKRHVGSKVVRACKRLFSR